jgi:hypothetical protein
VNEETPPIYRSLMKAIERARWRRGWPLWKLEEEAMLSDGHVSKLQRNSGRDVGRHATWKTIQQLIGALYPNGAEVALKPCKPDFIATASFPTHQTKLLRAYLVHQLAVIAPLGGHARAAALTPAQRQAISRKGAMKRWAHKRRFVPRTTNGRGRDGNAT